MTETNLDPLCATCGHPRSNHPYRHSFVGPSRDDTMQALAAERDALAARLEEAERDLKNLQDRIEVKGGGADAPTQWAYEQACAALHRHKERADDAERQRDAIETTYSQACDDYSAAHVAQQEAERQRDYVAARLIEAEEKVAAYEAMHEAAQKDGGPSVMRRQMELRRYKVRAEEAERQRDKAVAALAKTLNGGRALPLTRDQLGRFVREAWVRWAKAQSSPKPKWLLSYDELDEPDKEADRQIGETIARWTLIFDAVRYNHIKDTPNDQA